MQQVFAVLADPIRFEIVGLLASGERTAGDIGAQFDVSGPAISRHLRVLRDSGVASCRHDAQRRLYSLNPAAVRDIETWAQQLLQQWGDRFEALGRHLDELASTGGEKS